MDIFGLIKNWQVVSQVIYQMVTFFDLSLAVGDNKNAIYHQKMIVFSGYLLKVAIFTNL